MENINENAENGNWIKLFRNFQKWEWYKDSSTKDVFIDLLLEAQYKDTRYKGIAIKRGQLTTSVNAISERTGLSVRNIRTALAHLEKTGEIDKQSDKHFTLITICKYDTYQCNNKESDKQTDNPLTNNRQTSDNLQERNNDKNDNNSSLKETIKENPAESPSEGTSPSSGVGSDEPTNCANENLNLNSKMRNENSSTSGEDSRLREPSLGSIKKLSSNLRIKNVSQDELIFFCNEKILNKNLGKDEEERIRELFTQYAHTNQDTTLKIFALKLLNELNKDFALKIKKKFQKEFSSEIASGKKNPFTLGDALQHLYGHYSEKSVEGCKKEIQNFYARLERNGFKTESTGKDVSLMGFLAYVAESLKTKLRTREQEAPFKKEELRKRLPNEDERVMEMLEATYDRYFNRGNWTSKNGNKIDLNMFTGYFRDDARKKLMEQGYVPKVDKSINRDGRKYYDPKDIQERLKKWSKH